MLAIPARSAGDFAAKVIAVTEMGEVFLGPDHPLWLEARRLTGG